MFKENHRKSGFKIFISVIINPVKPQLRYVISNAKKAGK